MIHNEKLIGILHICYEPTRTIDEQEKKLLKNVANELAFARENVRIQKAIKKSEKKFRMVVENANSFIYVRDEEGRLTYVNPRAVEMLGYSKDELLGEKTWQFFHPQDRKNPKQQKKIKKVQHGEPVEGVVRLKTKSGETLHLKTRAVPIKENGELKQVIGIAMDITERLTYESKLQLYKQAIERSNDLMYAVNKEYRYIFANETYLQYHGVSRDDLIGMHIKKFLGKKVFLQEESYYKRVLKGFRYIFFSNIFLVSTACPQGGCGQTHPKVL